MTILIFSTNSSRRFFGQLTAMMPVSKPQFQTDDAKTLVFLSGDIFPRFRLGRKLQFCGSGAVNEPQGIERATGGNLTGKTERILGASQNLKQRLGFVVARREKNRLFCRQQYAGATG